MTRKSSGKPSHRPKINIDWEMVGKLLEAGCSATQIAGKIGCCPDTLYIRCENDLGLAFSVYCQQKRSKGEALLHAKQFNVAMQGDKSMLIWLGKNRLGQKDKDVEEEKAKEFITNVISFAGAAKKD